MSTAWSLARSLKDVEVTIIEPCPCLGGVACTKEMNGQVINYGVQGGAPASHRNIISLIREFGEDIDDAHLSVSFGKGEYHWSNYEDSGLQQRLQPDIQRFGRLIKWISRLEFLTLFLSIDTVMKWSRLSQEFRERMVYPLVALFFGTGNQTPNMSAAIVARVFNDPSLALFEYSPKRHPALFRGSCKLQKLHSSKSRAPACFLAPFFQLRVASSQVWQFSAPYSARRPRSLNPKP